MSQFIFKLPDLGEGTVEAEIVAWHTKPGDLVKEDQVIVEVMTDKAAVEVPAPVSGRVLSISGQPGDKLPVGSPLIVFDLDGAGKPAPSAVPAAGQIPAPATASPAAAASQGAGQVLTSGRVKVSPANRRRAREAGIDLSTVAGTGPGGRILSGDLLAAGGQTPRAGHAATPAGVSVDPPPASRSLLDQHAIPQPRSSLQGPAPAGSSSPDGPPATTEIKVIGVRRIIAERMSEAKRTIPHFSYVEEVDLTELESLRAHLNGKIARGEPSLTYLPLVIMALTRTLRSFPQCNVLHDAARGVLVRHAAVHVGIATQTPDGLKVPVVRNAQGLSLWELAAAIRQVSERARTNKATRDELVGSTITVTSLGKLGGIASTPVINAPEVAIIGLNKAVERPMVLDGAVTVRRMMNLSSSFDHRFVDGYDAAAMIQTLKELIEHPAMIFIS